MNHKLSISLLVISGLFFVSTQASQPTRHTADYYAEKAKRISEEKQKNRVDISKVTTSLHDNVKKNSWGYSDKETTAKHTKIDGMPSWDKRDKYDKQQEKRIDKNNRFSEYARNPGTNMWE